MAAKKKSAKKPQGIIDDIIVPIGKKVVARATKKITQSPQEALPRNLRQALDTAALAGTKKKATQRVGSEIADAAKKKKLVDLQRLNIAEERLLRARKTLMGTGTGVSSRKIDQAIAGATKDIRNRRDFKFGVEFEKEISARPVKGLGSATPYNVAKGARRAGAVGAVGGAGFAAGRGSSVPKQKPKPKGKGSGTSKKK